MDSITKDALFMRTLSTLLESTCHRRDTNLQEFSNALADLCLTAESDTLVGNVFSTQEEFATWFNFAQDFVGTERVPMPERSSHVDLEELGSRLARTEPSPVAGPLSITRRGPSISSTSIMPSIAVDSPDVQTSHNSEEDEDEVLDQLADESDE